MKFVTTCNPKPIPDRSFDWECTVEMPDEDSVVGFGATEFDALRNFVDNLEARISFTRALELRHVRDDEAARWLRWCMGIRI